jgi:diaminopimelate epimerase
MALIFASKYQAYGNDYLVLGSDQVPESDWPRLTRDICEAHFGVGADGCVFLTIPSDGPAQFRILNPDGSEAGMSGNGSRCALAFLHHKRVVTSAEVDLSTRKGLRTFSRVEEGDGFWRYRAAMGSPDFAAAQIPFLGVSPESSVEGLVLDVAGRTARIDALSVGNPQCVVIREDLPSESEFQVLGPALATHPKFPEGTNVSFVRVLNDRKIEIRIWERGVGPTHSSGTGCFGAAVAVLRAGLASSPLEVMTRTGSQIVEWVPEREIYLTGEVRFVADIHYQWGGA